jgi:hypothetical protein
VKPRSGMFNIGIKIQQDRLGISAYYEGSAESKLLHTRYGFIWDEMAMFLE